MSEVVHSPSPYALRLLKAMEHRNVTKSQLAQALEISATAIGKLAAGTSKSLTAENHVRAARFLQVSSDWLALNEGEMLLVNNPMRDLNGIEGQLITFFRGMSQADQDRLVAAANNIFNKRTPAQPSQANPFAKVPRPPRAEDQMSGSSGAESGLGELS